MVASRALEGLVEAMSGELAGSFPPPLSLLIFPLNTHTVSLVFLSLLSSSLAGPRSLDLDFDLYHQHPLHDHH
jgi:hypothetical protein